MKKELIEIAAKIANALRARNRKPRPPRVCVIGFPNVGKSSIVNRLLNQKACRTAPRPGVTRELTWCLVGTSKKGRLSFSGILLELSGFRLACVGFAWIDSNKFG